MKQHTGTHHFIFLLHITTFLVECCRESQNQIQKEKTTRIRTNICIAAVQYRLVASTVLADVCQGLNDPQTELLSLLVLVDRYILDMSDASQATQELAFYEHASHTDDAVGCFIDDNNRIVCLWGSAHGVKLGDPCRLAWVCHDCQDGKYVEVATMVVGGCQRADLP